MSLYGEKRHWPYAVSAVAIIIVFLSAQSQSRLVKTPPAEFFAGEAGHDRSVEMEIATAYWECARSVIQSKYHYGQMLPEAAPEEFNLANCSSTEIPLAKKQESRVRYWQKLRRVWLLPESWKHTYTLNFSWVDHGLEHFKNFLPSPKIGALPYSAKHKQTA